MKFMSDNFIKPEDSLCYGLNTGATKKYDAESGAIVFDGGDDVGENERKMSDALAEIYFNDTENDPLKPQQRSFRPIQLKLKFHALKLNLE